MIRIIDRHIGLTVLSSIMLVLLVLIGLFTFFSFIDELDDIGKANYSTWHAMQYVLLEVPANMYELFPAAALLGVLVGLGILAGQNELTVLRASGMSILHITGSVMKIGIPMTLLFMLIGEVVAPRSEQYAENLRSVLQSSNQQVIFRTQYGFWARDGQQFINIRSILPDGRFGAVTLYQFDDTMTLKALIRAHTAAWDGQEWRLESVERTSISTRQVQREYLKELRWQALLNPELIKVVTVNPRTLSIGGLNRYIDYLESSGQRSAEYQLALWTRISYPLASIAMIMLAIPFVFGSLRSVSVGQRVLVGAFMGIGFYMLYKASGNLGLVYNMDPLLTALMPSLIAFILSIWFMRRVA